MKYLGYKNVSRRLLELGANCFCIEIQEEKLGWPAQMACIRCGEFLSKANAGKVPYLCNNCRGEWKTTSVGVLQSVAWSGKKPWEEFFLVVLSVDDITGIYDPRYERNPVHLGFVRGYRFNKRTLKFFTPGQVQKILKLFQG
ncbi:MAG TPA: hypothetical protein VK254_00680 [Candidatus Bathyarchaeia archaeon]|nr:hypothetical protein [Candidatus Bathyarchaeia archaeon]